MMAYAEHNDDRFPTNLNDFDWESSETRSRLACSSRGVAPNDNSHIDNVTTYKLIPGRTRNDNRDAVLAYCPNPKHTGANKMYCVLFAGGHVLQLPKDEFEQLNINQ